MELIKTRESTKTPSRFRPTGLDEPGVGSILAKRRRVHFPGNRNKKRSLLGRPPPSSSGPSSFFPPSSLPLQSPVDMYEETGVGRGGGGGGGCGKRNGGSRAKDIPVSSQHQSGGKEEEEEEATIDVSSPSPPCARVSVGERSSHFLPFLFHNHTRHHHTCGLELQRTKKAKEQPTVIWTHSGTMIANPVADIFTLRTHVSLRVAKGDIHVGERTWFSQSAVSRIHACQKSEK